MKITTIKIDFHVHTEKSVDSQMKLDKIISIMKKLGFNGIAITDHNKVPNFDTSFKDKFALIRGEEILTRTGEVIALNIEKRIKPMQKMSKTLTKIIDQDGTIIFPHPYNILKKGVIMDFHILNEPFAVESLNGTSFIGTGNLITKYMAKRYGLATCGNSDAHIYKHLGCAYTVLPKCRNISSILHELVIGNGIPTGKTVPLYLNFPSYFNMIVKPVKKYKKKHI